MTIDLKNNRIRIYRQTLHLLDNPLYIQFFVKPDTHVLAIKPGSANDICSQKVYLKTLTNKRKCCEFYSKQLIAELRTLTKNNYGNHTYRIIGNINLERNRVFFDLQKAKPIRDDFEEELIEEHQKNAMENNNVK